MGLKVFSFVVLNQPFILILSGLVYFRAFEQDLRSIFVATNVHWNEIS